MAVGMKLCRPGVCAITLVLGAAPWNGLPGAEILDVHVHAGHIAWSERDGNSPRIRVQNRGGGPEVIIQPAEGVPFKQPFVRGFAVLERNRLGVILADESRPDPSRQRVMVYDLARPDAAPMLWPARKTNCGRLAVADADKLWCLGDSDDRNLLHLLGPLGKAGSLLRGHAGRGSGGGRLGLPQLLSMPQGVIAWLPEGGSLVMFTGSSTGIEIPLPPHPTSGRSILSYALLDNGALFALAPLLVAGDEPLPTRYGLFAFVSRENGWRRWKPERDFARGTVLAGSDGREVALWLRERNELEFLSVQ